MEKCKLKKAKNTQQILEGLVNKVNEITSANVSHKIASIRSITTNLNMVMINELLNACDENDGELKLLLKKIERNIWAVDTFLKDLTPITAENGKLHTKTWIQFYADALSKILNKYEI